MKTDAVVLGKQKSSKTKKFYYYSLIHFSQKRCKHTYTIAVSTPALPFVIFKHFATFQIGTYFTELKDKVKNIWIGDTLNFSSKKYMYRRYLKFFYLQKCVHSSRKWICDLSEMTAALSDMHC